MVRRLPFHWKQIQYIEIHDHLDDVLLSLDPEHPFWGQNMGKKRAVISVDRIESSILMLRGHKVMLDTDLATLYGVPTKALNQAVKRNLERFPSDFMFQLKGRRQGI